MAKIKAPVLFSDHFGVKRSDLKRLGALDPTLNVDTGLFIDPLLLTRSRHTEINKNARATYEKHFLTVISLLKKTKSSQDVAWRTAQKFLSFPEIKGTCLGFGAESVSGSGSGARMTGQLMQTAHEIVALGVEDPDLFVAMALFEDGFGPDRISDMTANIIFGDLVEFNNRILTELGVPRRMFEIESQTGSRYDANLPVNPYVRGGAPVILVPADILRNLPIAKDWSEIADAASKNAQLRRQVNEKIARLWTNKTLKDKRQLRQWALSGKSEFHKLLEMIRGVDARPYDLEADARGEVFWRSLATLIAKEEPLAVQPPLTRDTNGINHVVDQIINQFKFLIEKRRLSEELFHDNTPRPEKSAQRLFFIVAHAYCKANNLDVTPEADTGNGPVDFKFSSGFNGRVIVEIKLSTNKKVIAGYTRQLEAYKAGEQTTEGFYVVVDVGGMGEKRKTLEATKLRLDTQGKKTSPIVFVDGRRRPSASKL